MRKNRPALIFFCMLALATFSVSADPAADAYREARAHLVAHRYAEAALRFETATATTNASAAAAAWFGRGEALYGMGKWDDAIAAYATLLKRYPTSPFAPNALCARGHAEQQSGRLPQALATFTTFRAQYPTNALSSSCATAIEKITRAIDAQTRQQARAAITQELAAINALLRTEKFAESSSAAERFLQAHPGHPQTAELRYLIATCAYRSRDYSRAADAYRAFLECHPQHARTAEARGQLADSLFRAERFDEARSFYTALREETTDPQEEARVTLALGDCDAAQKKWDAAERAYLGVEVLQGCDALRPVALERLAALYEKMGQPDKAQRTREDLRRRYPN